MESENRTRAFTEEVARHIEASEFTPAQVAHELHINPNDLDTWLNDGDLPWLTALEVFDLLGVPLGSVMADA